MGSDREARVLGAGETIEVGEKTYTLRPIVVQHLCDLEREALRHYKRQYLSTFSENADLLGEGRAGALLEEKMAEVAAWDLSDLPQRFAHDTSRVPVTKKLRAWIEEQFAEVPDTDAGIRALLTNALDTNRVNQKDVRRMTDKYPLRGRVRYDQWWVTASSEGMVSFIASSVRRDHPEVTKEDVAGWPFAKIAEASRKVEAITSADMGNM